MPIEVEGPDGVVIEFPDNTAPAVMQRVMAQRYPKPKAPKAAPRPNDARQALRTGEARLAAQTARATPAVRADALRRYNADPRVVSLRKAAEAEDTRPTSFWQGVGEGLGGVASNAASLLGKLPVIGTPIKAAGVGMDIARGDIMSAMTPDAGRTARRVIRDVSDASSHRGSTAGKITGQVLGTIPTAGMGVVMGGGMAGALTSSDPDDRGQLLTDTMIGAAGGKAIDVVGRRVIAPVARPLIERGARVFSRASQSAAEPIRNVAARLGVRPTPATVGGNVATIMQTGIGATPGGSGAVARGVEREVGDLASAARGVAESMGTVSTPQAAGERLVRGAQAFERGTRSRGRALYNARDELMGGTQTPVLMDSAAATARDFAEQFPNMSSQLFEHPAIRQLVAAMPDGPQPQLTLSEATDALSHIRAAVRNAERSNTMTGPIKARISAFEQAIENDVMRAAQGADAIMGRSGAGSATEAQRAADAFWAGRSRALGGPLKKAMASARDVDTTSAESVYRQMVADMNREGGNLSRLNNALGALPQGARREFAATTFDRLGRATAGAQDDVGAEWSFNTFLTNYDKMAPAAREAVFGRGAQGQIADIARYSARLRQNDRLRNFSNTARTGLAAVYLTALGQQAWEGDAAGVAKGALAFPAMALGGRAFMASPAGRAWVRNTMQALTRAGTPAAERTLQNLTAQLPLIASRTPALREEAMALYRAVANDNLAAPIAAEPSTADNQQSADQTPG